uniref:B30.2/SPRY domain-containing protein n=1 Tax=Maylandia zebra TaxID=106582 RepID=A0A3P9AQX1_9CICH
MHENKSALIQPSSNFHITYSHLGCQESSSKCQSMINGSITAAELCLFSPSDSCQLIIDTNTVNRHIKLSDNNSKMTHVEEVQSYPDHPDRFDYFYQLMCSTGLTGRCYWEVEWKETVEISVSYRRIRRKGDSYDCVFGWNDHSWSLICSEYGPHYVMYNNRVTFITSSSSPVSNRVAVYVDCPAGSLSFYRVSSDTLIHLHTFNTTFTETLYPGFGFNPGASVSLC